MTLAKLLCLILRVWRCKSLIWASWRIILFRDAEQCQMNSAASVSALLLCLSLPLYFFPFLLHETHQVLIHGLHKFKTGFFDQMKSLKETLHTICAEHRSLSLPSLVETFVALSLSSLLWLIRQSYGCQVL